MAPNDDWVVLATIVRSRGLRGEMFIDSLSGGPETFQGRDVVLRRGKDNVRPAHIDQAWPQSGRVIVKLAGVDTIEAAEALRGVELCVAPEDRLPLAEGEFYLSDLIGCELFDAGKLVGPVIAWQESPGAVLLTVSHDSRESLIPLVKAICHEVDVPNRRILANLPVGLLDL